MFVPTAVLDKKNDNFITILCQKNRSGKQHEKFCSVAAAKYVSDKAIFQASSKCLAWRNLRIPMPNPVGHQYSSELPMSVCKVCLKALL